MPGRQGENRPRCRGHVKSGPRRGKACDNRAADGSMYCGVHGGSKRKVGAPTKLTRDLADQIAENVKIGCTYDRAAQAAGIHRSTFLLWRATGEQDWTSEKDTPYAYLFAELMRAEAEGEVSLVRVIRGAAAEDWRAAAHLLAVRWPERHAKRIAVDATSQEVSRPREVTPAGDARDRILEIVRTAIQPPAGADDVPA